MPTPCLLNATKCLLIPFFFLLLFLYTDGMRILFTLSQTDLPPCQVRVLEDENTFFVVFVWHDIARRTGTSRSIILTPHMCALASKIVQTLALDPQHCRFLECHPLPLAFTANEQRWHAGGGYSWLHFTWNGKVAFRARWERVPASQVAQWIIPFPDIQGEDIWLQQS
jgi:hypothetical protein